MIEAGFHNLPLLTREQLSELIRIASDLVGLTKLAQILGVSATAVYEWQIRGVQPTFVLYLRLARVLNVPLTDFLTGRSSLPEFIPFGSSGYRNGAMCGYSHPQPLEIGTRHGK